VGGEKPGEVAGVLVFEAEAMPGYGEVERGRCKHGQAPVEVAVWADDAKEDAWRRRGIGGEVSEAGQNDRADPAAELPVVPGGVYRPFEAGEG
jgi:hypothetical protein